MLQGRAKLTGAQRRFLDHHRVGRLATADRAGAPHVVPVCYALGDDTLYIAIDQKPKRRDVPLKRERNIAENPNAAFVVDRYDEDWTRLGWVMLRGAVELLAAGDEYDRAQALCRARYPQLRSMDLTGLPVIALRIRRVASWGDLAVA
ncbi:MAG TPA: TIGR03668 family PPOX class F420-dependent oxidoreductase [Stellaceae bacterium]|nr:TIGR03668 family PPOX class F420-dependent oxidoreductase [Stellaceae bacterium]